MKRIPLIALAVSLSAYGAGENDVGMSTANPFSPEGFLRLIANTPGVTPTTGIGGEASIGTTAPTPITPDNAGGAATPVSPATPAPGAAPAAPAEGQTTPAPNAATPPLPSGTPPADAAGAAFLAAAYQDGLAEIELAGLAATRAENNDVKEFAAAMVQQHTIVNAELQKLASAKNVPLPTIVTSTQAAEVSRLSGLLGADFDREYMRQNVTTHRADLASAMRMAATTSDDNVRLFAAVIAPTLKTHLIFAEDILNRLDPTAFLVSAYQNSLAEVKWAQVALDRASDDRVRRFAQKMITEHTEANARIAALAVQKQVTLPAEITSEEQAIAEDLVRFGGADFDRAYMDTNVTAHAKAVRYARVQMGASGLDAGVRQLAGTLEPDLAGHLINAAELARQIEPSFYYRAYQSNLAEIRVAYVAIARSRDSQIISYAQRMIVEHAPVLLQLRQLAETQNTATPADVRFLTGAQIIALPVDMSPEETLAYSALLTASDNVFDGGYAAYNERLHDKAIDRFNEETQRPTSPQTQAFAQALLTTLNVHRDEARAQLTRLGRSIQNIIDQVESLRGAV